MSVKRAVKSRGGIVRFTRDERGATAVEFALISIPFMLLLFGVVELVMMFLTSAVLETASETAARRIRTGEFQQGGATAQADFKTLVCNGMLWLQPNCTADLYVDVQTFTNFAGLAADAPVVPGSLNPGATCFAPGNPMDIVLVRTYFRWKLFTPLLNGALQNAGDGMRLINTTTAFRNEPYSDQPPQGASC